MYKSCVNILLLLSLTACTGNEGPNMSSDPQQETASLSTLSGSVTYRERILLTGNIELTLTLSDSNGDDIATNSVVVHSSPPWQYTLDYEPSLLEASKDYLVTAEVYADKRLRFTRVVPLKDLTADTQALDILLHAASATLSHVEWQLSAIGAASFEENPDKVPTITFDSKAMRVSGFSGCNRFSGNYSLTGNTLKFGMLMSTQMACADDNNSEFKYLQAFSSVGGYKVAQDTLVLLDAEGEAVLSFKR